MFSRWYRELNLADGLILMCTKAVGDSEINFFSIEARGPAYTGCFDMIVSLEHDMALSVLFEGRY